MKKTAIIIGICILIIIVAVFVFINTSEQNQTGVPSQRIVNSPEEAREMISDINSSVDRTRQDLNSLINIGD